MYLILDNQHNIFANG